MLENIKIPLLVVLGVVLAVVLARAFMGGQPPPVATAPVGAAVAPPGTPATAPASGALANASSPTEEPLKMEISNVDVVALTEEIKQVQFVYETWYRDAAGQDHEKRNPMKSPIFTISNPNNTGVSELLLPDSPLSRTRVIAIVWDDQFPVAIVRNEGALKKEERQDRCIYKGYAYSNNIIVQSIERDKVVFKMNDTEFPISLGSGAIEPTITFNGVK